MEYEEMTNFFCQHVNKVRKFVANYPSMSLIEFDLEDENAADYLAGIFPQLNASDWGQKNKGAFRKVTEEDEGGGNNN